MAIIDRDPRSTVKLSFPLSLENIREFPELV